MSSSIQLRNAQSWSNLDGIVRNFGEICFAAFGFHINLDGVKTDRPYFEITNFINYKFNERADVVLPLQYLLPKSMFPGMYL